MPRKALFAAALAAPLLGVVFLRAGGVRGHLPFAATAFALPWVGAVAAAQGGGVRAGAVSALAALPALGLAFLLGSGKASLLPCALGLVLAVALAAAGLAQRLGEAGPPLVTLLLVVAVATPWWFEPVLRALPGAEGRARAAAAALAVNPVAAACDLFGTDWMRRERMYAVSSIGPDVPVRYPRWTATALACATAGVLLVRKRTAPESPS
ncbi:MAG TPA: hypothetical protein VFI25_11560 [Planctomycetota bacterium]|jgi:hypothetical protein|nr:hypothetical protein [Planctomycetota bacterium]